MARLLLFIVLPIIIGACASGRYQWVDTQGRGQSGFQSAHYACQSAVAQVAGPQLTREQLMQQDAAFGNNLTPLGLATAIGGSAGRHVGNIAGLEDPRMRPSVDYNGCMSGFGFQRRFVPN